VAGWFLELLDQGAGIPHEGKYADVLEAKTSHLEEGKKAEMDLLQRLLDGHENSNKENLRNREPGCIYTIEYANSESSSLFFYNPSRETVVYCQSRLHYRYKATVRRSNE
jgi:hypothetical protein